MSTHLLPTVGSTGTLLYSSDSAASANTIAERGASAEIAFGATTVTQIIATAMMLGVTNKTSTFTASVTEAAIYTVDSSGGAVTMNLPAAASSTNAAFIVFHKTAGNNLVIDPNSTELINGASTKTSGTANQAAIIFCNGTAWYSLQIGTWT